jgi:PIN domain nuclease of toxin-antitoxin system
MVILDTCCLIELCQKEPKISNKCRAQIEEGAIILSISFAEIACKVQFGKLTMNLSPRDLYQEYRSIPSIAIIETSAEDWFDSIELDWDHKDPADRLIVAYAQRNKSPIVTTDKRIKKFYKNVLW